MDEKDEIGFLAASEKRFIGVRLTATNADGKAGEIYDFCSDCKMDAPNFTKLQLGVVIDKLYLHTVKTGKNAGKTMAKLDVHDLTGTLSKLVVFTDLFEERSDLLIPGNTIGLQVYKKDDSWLTKDIIQL